MRSFILHEARVLDRTVFRLCGVSRLYLGRDTDCVRCVGDMTREPIDVAMLAQGMVLL